MREFAPYKDIKHKYKDLSKVVKGSDIIIQVPIFKSF